MSGEEHSGKEKYRGHQTSGICTPILIRWAGVGPIYAQDLATLREKEKRLMKDQLDGLDLYVAGKATINDTYDRYISTKYDLRATTRSNYDYMYNRLSDILSVRRKSQTLSIQTYSSFIATCLKRKSYR